MRCFRFLMGTVATLAPFATLACSRSVQSTSGSAGPPAQAASIGPTLTPQVSGTANRLQAVSAVNESVVWASGLNGTFVVTTDGGKTWRSAVVPGAENLEFRDVEGVSARVAYLLAAGTGPASRIYKTTDGGGTWQLQFQNADSLAFYDCFDFWAPDRGITMSDAVNGRFPVIKTTDGRTWHDVGNQLPPAQNREAAFAASGTCVTTEGGSRAWIATGGAPKARVLATSDGGATWSSYPTPIVQGTSTSGGFSIAFRDPSHGILGGGELTATLPQGDNVAVSNDGGRTWNAEGVAQRPFPGAIFGISYVPGHGERTVVATGPGGAAWSADEARNWNLLPDVAGYWSVDFAGRTGWLVGTEGRILKIRF